MVVLADRKQNKTKLTLNGEVFLELSVVEKGERLSTVLLYKTRVLTVTVGSAAGRKGAILLSSSFSSLVIDSSGVGGSLSPLVSLTSVLRWRLGPLGFSCEYSSCSCSCSP